MAPLLKQFTELFTNVGGPYSGKDYDKINTVIRYSDIIESLSIIKSSDINLSNINLVSPSSDIELKWEQNKAQNKNDFFYPTIAVVGNISIIGG